MKHLAGIVGGSGAGPTASRGVQMRRMEMHVSGGRRVFSRAAGVLLLFRRFTCWVFLFFEVYTVIWHPEMYKI